MLTKPDTKAILLVFVCGLGIALLNLYWISLDTRPQPVIDEYVEKTLNLADGLMSHPVSEYPRLAYWATIGPRPSLYQVMATPFVLYVERSPDAMLLVNAIFFLVLVLATYKIAELSMNWKAGLLGALIVATYPVITDFSRLVFPHGLIPAVTALVILIMMLTLRRRTPGMAWLVSGGLFLAFSVHASSLNNLLGIALLFSLYTAFFQIQPRVPQNLSGLYAWVRFKLNDPFVLYGLVPAMLFLFGFIVVWLVLKWDQWQALHQVIQEVFAPRVTRWQFERALPDYISWMYTILLLLGLFTAVVQIALRPAGYSDRLFLLVTLGSMFGVSHLTGATFVYNFSGVLPLMAVLTALGVLDSTQYVESRIRSTTIKQIVTPLVFLACMLGAAVNYATAGWGVTIVPPKQPEIFSKDPSCGRGVCPKQPIGGDWHIQPLLTAILSDPQCRDQYCTVTLVSHRQNYFSDAALTYSMVQFFPEESKRNSGSFYPERTVDFKRTEYARGRSASWLLADYSIFLTTGDGRPEGGSRLATNSTVGLEPAIIDSISRRLTVNPGNPFALVYQAPLPNGLLVNLVRRVRPIPLAEAIEIVDAMHLPEADKRLIIANLMAALGDESSQ